MSSSNDNVAEAQEPGVGFNSDVESLKTSFNQLRHDLTHLVNSAMGVGKHGASAVKERAAGAVDGLKDRLHDLKDKGANSVDAVEQKISDHPLTTAMIAFGIGYVLGKMFSRK